MSTTFEIPSGLAKAATFTTPEGIVLDVYRTGPTELTLIASGRHDGRPVKGRAILDVAEALALKYGPEWQRIVKEICRDELGRFAPCGISEHPSSGGQRTGLTHQQWQGIRGRVAQGAQQKIDAIRGLAVAGHGRDSPKIQEHVRSLAYHLMGMTVSQLHQIKAANGLKAAAGTKAALKEKIVQRLHEQIAGGRLPASPASATDVHGRSATETAAHYAAARDAQARRQAESRPAPAASPVTPPASGQSTPAVPLHSDAESRRQQGITEGHIMAPGKWAAGTNPAEVARGYGLPEDFYTDARRMERDRGGFPVMSGEVHVNDKYDPDGKVRAAVDARQSAASRGLYEGTRRRQYDEAVRGALAGAVARARQSASPVKATAPVPTGKEHVKPGTFGPSKAKIIVGRFSEGGQAKLEESAKTLLGTGATLQDFASATGAPHGATATVSRNQDGSVSVRYRGETETKDPVTGKKKTEEYDADRTVIHVPGVGTVVRNNSFEGKGTGLEMFARQVENATRLGVKQIRTYAAGSFVAGPDPNRTYGHYNGYTTWPRFGYNGTVRLEIREQLPAAARAKVEAAGNQVSALMGTAADRKTWLYKGGGINDAKFDLTPGSYSQRTLTAYLHEKGLTDASGNRTAARPGKQA